jgi:hypothetical protein
VASESKGENDSGTSPFTNGVSGSAHDGLGAPESAGGSGNAADSSQIAAQAAAHAAAQAAQAAQAARADASDSVPTSASGRVRREPFSSLPASASHPPASVPGSFHDAAAAKAGAPANPAQGEVSSKHRKGVPRDQSHESSANAASPALRTRTSKRTRATSASRQDSTDEVAAVCSSSSSSSAAKRSGASKAGEPNKEGAAPGSKRTRGASRGKRHGAEAAVSPAAETKPKPRKSRSTSRKSRR